MIFQPLSDYLLHRRMPDGRMAAVMSLSFGERIVFLDERNCPRATEFW